MNSQRLDLLYQYAVAAAAQGDFGNRELGPIHLLKYAYLGDLAHAEAHAGQTFTNVEWRFHHFGPWAVEAFQRIEPAMSAVGAARRTFRGKYQDENVRWSTRDRSLLDRLESQLPREVARSVRRAMRKHGTDTVSLLHEVYKTKPMLRSAPGEVLDFRASLDDEIEPQEHRTQEAQQAEEAGEDRPRLTPISKTRAKRLRKLVKERLAKKRAAKTARPLSPPPRYDDVFFRGMEWLDQLAGEPVEPTEGRLSFSDDIWHSRARREPELP